MNNTENTATETATLIIVDRSTPRAEIDAICDGLILAVCPRFARAEAVTKASSLGADSVDGSATERDDLRDLLDAIADTTDVDGDSVWA